MNRILILLFCAISLAAGGYSAPAYDLDRSFQSSPGKSLDINLDTGGDVTVTGTTSNEVRVKVRLTGRDSEDLDVQTRESSSGVEVTSRYDGDRRSYNANADIEVEVPSQYNVSVDTMGGEIAIKQVEGRFSGKTMGGEITLSNLKGDADLTTMGGDIDVTDSELDGSVHTMGGDVVLRNVGGSLKGSTMGGNVREEGSTGSKTSSGKGEKRIHSMGGDLNLNSAPEGASLETMGGDIHITSAGDHVKATTMGGDIQVDAIDGWADLSTMGGDVTVRMVGDGTKGKRDVEISSMAGDIELTLPANISATFDLKTEYEDSRLNKPRITSDFPVEVNESSRCSHEHDRPCKSLEGRGKSGDGTHRIHIRTVEGNIIIKKG